jgi:hypothetical protein
MAKHAKKVKKREARKRHSEALTALFIEFQIIEEALKIYLRRRGRSSVDGLTLKPLIDRFARRSGDLGLARKLHALVKPRDHCAHRAYLEAFVASNLSVAERNEKVGNLWKLRDDLLGVQDSLRPHLDKVGAFLPGADP